MWVYRKQYAHERGHVDDGPILFQVGFYVISTNVRGHVASEMEVVSETSDEAEARRLTHYLNGGNGNHRTGI